MTHKKTTKGYVHGFTPEEQERLYRQARFVEHRVHALDPLFIGLSWAGSLSAVWLVLALVLAVVWRRPTLFLAVLLAGSIIVENVFVLPGLGRLVFQAIQQNDLIVVRNAVLVIAAMVLLINFAVDLCYLALNPRLRVR